MEVGTYRSRLFPPLHHFCYCLTLAHGIHVITVMAFVFGAGFLFFANQLNSEEFTGTVIFLCNIAGILFFTWFLALLLLLSLRIKLPRRLALWTAVVLSVWLLLMFLFLTTIACIISYDENLQYVALVMVGSFLGYAFTIYGIWVIKSYIHLLDQQSRPPSDVRIDDSNAIIRRASSLSQVTFFLNHPQTSQTWTSTLTEDLNTRENTPESTRNLLKTLHFWNLKQTGTYANSPEISQTPQPSTTPHPRELHTQTSPHSIHTEDHKYPLKNK